METRYWCSTCGVTIEKEEIDCDKCKQWWKDNSPESEKESKPSAIEISEVEKQLWANYEKYQDTGPQPKFIYLSKKYFYILLKIWESGLAQKLPPPWKLDNYFMEGNFILGCSVIFWDKDAIAFSNEMFR